MSGITVPSGLSAPALATAVGFAGAALGLWLTGLRQRARVVVPFSAGVLLGVAVFGLVPELSGEIGWPATLALFGGGYGALLLVNRYVYRVCPTCSHDHDHNSCSTELHGFAAPLIAAAALHSFVDGWSIATVQLAVPLELRVAVPLAVSLHKIPEGLALGGILRASVRSRGAAAGWALVAEGATLLGGAAGMWAGPHLGSEWITFPVGIAAGWLFYLGYHAVHEETKRRGVGAAGVAALAGIAGAAVILRGVESWMR
ncbi:MAG: ZIP family metal transporter [Acidobacteriota bacterium]|nr:ZIP family metal transporter [Acidobacteriota bacterium]